jgi:hypothetical protein
MNYSKYFKTGHKLQLHVIDPKGGQPHSEVITTLVVGCTEDHIELLVPYLLKSDEAPQLFEPESRLLIMSEFCGMGIRLNGTYVNNISRDSILIKPDEKMEIFTRRTFPRVDTKISLLVRRSLGSLNTGKALWMDGCRAAAQGVSPFDQANPRRHEVNLSAGGLSVQMKSPVYQSELCMLILQLPGNSPPIWALSEVIWFKTGEEELNPTGLKFMQIMTEDQLRINAFVMAELKSQGIDLADSLMKKETLSLLQFDADPDRKK